MYRTGIFDHTVPMEGKTATAAASGSASLFYGPVPQGYCWYVERISTHGPTANTKLDVHVSPTSTTVDDGTRADFSPTANDAIADETNPIYVPEGYYLVFNWSAATSGDVLVASVQRSVHQLETRYLMSPQDVRQVEAAREKPTAEVAETATATRRAV